MFWASDDGPKPSNLPIWPQQHAERNETEKNLFLGQSQTPRKILFNLLHKSVKSHWTWPKRVVYLVRRIRKTTTG